MRNYLHRLLERTTGEPSAAQRALVPEAVPRREGPDDDPLDLSALSEPAARPAPPRQSFETRLMPSLSRGELPVPSTATFREQSAVPVLPARPSAIAVAPAPARMDRESATPTVSLRADAPRVEATGHRNESPGTRLEAAIALRGHDREPLDPSAPPPLGPTRSEVAPAAEVRGRAGHEPLTPSVTPKPPPLPTVRLEPPKIPITEAPRPERTPLPLAPPPIAERAPLPPPAPMLSIGRLVVEVMPSPQAALVPAPVIVPRSAPAPTPPQSNVLRRGFGLGQS